MVGRGGIAILTLAMMAFEMVLQGSRLSASIVTMRAPVGLLTYRDDEKETKIMESCLSAKASRRRVSTE